VRAGAPVAPRPVATSRPPGATQQERTPPNAGANATVVGNTATSNRGHGITGAWGATIVDNTASDNAIPLGPALHGISCGSGCTVRGNTAHLNSGFGLSLGASSAYGENTLVDNGQGGASGGVSTGGNYCAGPNVGAPGCP
jgi:parallel beta-helix repeat protein